MKHCSRCEDLEEQIAYLRSELGLALSADQVKRVQVALGVTPNAARLLLALYAAKGKTRTRAQMLDSMPSNYEANDGRGDQLVTVYVCRLRASLGKSAIETVWGQGFRLSGAGIDLVRSIVEQRVAA